MKRFVALMLSVLMAFSITSCGNPAGNEEQPEKIYLANTRSVGKELQERKAFLQAAFDHSVYNKQYITVIEKEDSPLAQNDNGEDVTDKWLFATTEDDKYVYLSNYSDREYVFLGKYSFKRDMYDFGGYDPGDRFVIYYEGELPEDGNLSECNLVTMIPEYTLIGSKAVLPEQGEKSVEFLTKVLNEFEYIDDDPRGGYISMEQAIIDVLEEQNMDSSAFYQQTLPAGGVYYTDGKTSVASITSIWYDPHYMQAATIVHRVLLFDGKPKRTNDIIYGDMIYERFREKQ